MSSSAVTMLYSGNSLSAWMSLVCGPTSWHSWIMSPRPVRADSAPGRRFAVPALIHKWTEWGGALWFNTDAMTVGSDLYLLVIDVRLTIVLLSAGVWSDWWSMNFFWVKYGPINWMYCLSFIADWYHVGGGWTKGGLIAGTLHGSKVWD